MKLTKELALELIKEQGNKITIPDIYTEIEISAFEGTDIKEIIIPELIKIGSHSFSKCGSLVKVIILNSKELPYMCFSDCLNLQSIQLPDTMTRIDTTAFLNCLNLREINYPSNLINPKFSFGSIIKSKKLVRKGVGKELLMEILNKKDELLELGLCSALGVVTVSWINENKEFINYLVELPHFTENNATLFGADVGNLYWWKFNKEGK